jgi:hypothetical protein
MKRILVLHYSQTGQLNTIVTSMLEPLMNIDGIDVVFEELKPKVAFPFPWGFTEFFNTFPETVHLDPVAMSPLSLDVSEYQSFDLIILAYQVWFLSPSLPVSSFLQSPEAAKILHNKPVITVIGCRNMWLQAQEQVKLLLQKVHAQLIDNVVLIDAGSTALSFISTPLWMLTGKKGPVGVLPRAGVSDDDIAAASRFGIAIRKKLLQPDVNFNHSMLQGLNAVKVNERLILSEKMARRGFFVWGKLLRAVGSKESLLRKILVYFYVVYLVTLILTVVPISAVIKALFAPFTKERIKQQKHYFSQPSGDENFNMELK